MPQKKKKLSLEEFRSHLGMGKKPERQKQKTSKKFQKIPKKSAPQKTLKIEFQC